MNINLAKETEFMEFICCYTRLPSFIIHRVWSKNPHASIYKGGTQI